MKHLYIDGKKIVKVFCNGNTIAVIFRDGVKIWEEQV